MKQDLGVVEFGCPSGKTLLRAWMLVQPAAPVGEAILVLKLMQLLSIIPIRIWNYLLGLGLVSLQGHYHHQMRRTKESKGLAQSLRSAWQLWELLFSLQFVGAYLVADAAAKGRTST